MTDGEDWRKAMDGKMFKTAPLRPASSTASQISKARYKAELAMTCFIKFCLNTFVEELMDGTQFDISCMP